MSKVTKDVKGHTNSTWQRPKRAKIYGQPGFCLAADIAFSLPQTLVQLLHNVYSSVFETALPLKTKKSVGETFTERPKPIITDEINVRHYSSMITRVT